MDPVRIPLRYRISDRIMSFYGVGVALVIATVMIAWPISHVLLRNVSGLHFAVLIAIVVAGHLVAAVAWRTGSHIGTTPTLSMERGAIVIHDPLILRKRQAIPIELVSSLHVGPDAAGLLVSAHRSRQTPLRPPTQLSRFPQLPNLVIVMEKSVLLTEARPRLFPLWHLSTPPAPDRAARTLWATVADPDAAYLVFHDWGLPVEWVTPDSELPVFPFG